MTTQVVVSFEGMSEAAAEKLALGMAATSKAQLSELLNRSDEIKKMSTDDVMKFKELLTAAKGDGNCGWGCSGT